MRVVLWPAALAAGCLLLVATPSGASELTDQQIRRRLIAESIAAYSGPCPCPYNVMRNRKPCGSNSAYSKPGGRSPLCYEKDVSDSMVRNYRARMAR